MRYRTVNEFIDHIASVKGDAVPKHTVWVCGGPGCVAAGSAAVCEALRAVVRGRVPAAPAAIKVKESGCMGPCERSVVVKIEPEGWFYEKVSPQDAEDIIASLLSGEPCGRLSVKDDGGRPVTLPTAENIPFFAGQVKLVSTGMQAKEPESFEAYLAAGGFKAFLKALTEMSPDEVCAEVDKSGLRGRGGGGFPTGRKWLSCRAARGTKKYVLVNGDEGDPGAFMDRSLMEGDPFLVLEGLMIGAYAIGAAEGVIYVRHEYPLAVVRLRGAIRTLEEHGLLGKNILGTGFELSLEICQGGGAFVCGESTALMTSIEGRAGVPRVKYIRSTEKGLWESPTVLNNVETWANVPMIIERGADFYKGLGTEKSPGTKIFALVGKVRHTGLVEVPMGVTLREIIYGIGGGIAEGRPFKAVQTGGPSGGCLPESFLDTPVDFDSLAAAGSMMGSGGMIVMDDRTCMVDVARYFIDFLVGESCGKCVPCREGLKKMQMLLRDLTGGKGRPGDTALLRELAEGVSMTALCALGQSAANPVLSTIKYFPEEYMEHEADHYCRAGVCSSMYRVAIDAGRCRGCSICAKNCPAGAIEKRADGKYRVREEKCIRCGVCAEKCPFGAVMAAKGARDDG